MRASSSASAAFHLPPLMAITAMPMEARSAGVAWVAGVRRRVFWVPTSVVGFVGVVVFWVPTFVVGVVNVVVFWVPTSVVGVVGVVVLGGPPAVAPTAAEGLPASAVVEAAGALDAADALGALDAADTAGVV